MMAEGALTVREEGDFYISTLTEMFVPRLDDLILVLLDNTFNFAEPSRTEFVLCGERHNWFQPELCFSTLACHMDIYSVLFVREKVESIPPFPED